MTPNFLIADKKASTTNTTYCLVNANPNITLPSIPSSNMYQPTMADQNFVSMSCFYAFYTLHPPYLFLNLEFNIMYRLTTYLPISNCKCYLNSKYFTLHNFECNVNTHSLLSKVQYIP